MLRPYLKKSLPHPSTLFLFMSLHVYKRYILLPPWTKFSVKLPFWSQVKRSNKKLTKLAIEIGKTYFFPKTLIIILFKYYLLEFVISTKGQLISKCLFGIFNSPKKTNEKIPLYYYGTSSRIIFVSFLGELKTPKRHFKINWPLANPIIFYKVPSIEMLKNSKDPTVIKNTIYWANLY